MSQGRTDINEGKPRISSAGTKTKKGPAAEMTVKLVADSDKGTDHDNSRPAAPEEPHTDSKSARPTALQLKWLARGMDQAGGKLPLFDASGRKVSDRTVQSCIEKGWAEPWFNNPLKPDWQVCRLTEAGRQLVASET